MKQLRQSYTVETLQDGTRALVVGWEVPEDAPLAVREGLARRAITNSGRPCPCGAVATLPSRAERRRANRAGVVLRRAVLHEDDCPAADDNLAQALVDGGWSA
ncbi:hypothetical protein [Ornithinimicrobium sp. W1665]|uniref:hypothetical protein n=1 Tax=Ornithinimicrobium sp. W1665 TaxID=3416666 RepID=UPI003CE90A99